MELTRREFLGCAAVALATRRAPAISLGRDEPRCIVLDLGESCGLRESVDGYRSASIRLTPGRSMLIIPAALAIPTTTIESWLDRGRTVILESGACFRDTDFDAHRAALRRELGIVVERPVALWPRAIPYVTYTWPLSTVVRDFSRVVPVAPRAGEIIATADGLPVALVRQAGRGRLVFLGSPLGPALWAGDAEATRWLQAIADTTSC